MPRAGGIYTVPVGTDGIPNTTIGSTPYNGFVHDVETDLNAPRPVIAGGTGGTNPTEARDNLDAEVAGAQVTNYDSHVFENGTLWSAPGATGAPNPTSGFAGICYMYSTPATGAMAVHIRDLNDSVQPGRLWSRQKLAGAWSGPWAMDSYVIKTGDTMSGDLIIKKNSPAVVLNKLGNGQNNLIYGLTADGNRWGVNVGDAIAETGGNVGSDFSISRYSDAGAFLGIPFGIARATGIVTVSPVLKVGAYPHTDANAASYVGFQGGGTFGTVYRQSIDSASPCVFYNVANAIVGSINTSATTTTYATSSDDRLKQDLQSFDAGRIVDDTMVYSFAWKKTGERSYGVSAQQANEVYPQAVTYLSDEDWYGIDYSKYVPVILQELKALRARVAELEGRLEAGATPA